MHWFELYNRITLCLVFVIKLTIQDNFTVYRTVNSSNFEYPWSSRDKFYISEAKCKETLGRNEDPCLEYGSFPQGKTCFCKCPWASPTFIYGRNSSKCEHVKDTRKSQGCGFLFHDESETAGLYYLTPTYGTFLKVPSNISQCNVNELTSEYLDCDSNWKPLTNINRANIFQLASAVDRGHRYQIKINWTAASNDLSGFIIKLGLTCQPENGSPCIMFKITGKLRCPVDSVVPPSTSSPTEGTMLTTPLQASSPFPPSFSEITTLSTPSISLSSLLSSNPSLSPSSLPSSSKQLQVSSSAIVPVNESTTAGKEGIHDPSHLRILFIVVPVAAVVIVSVVFITAFCILWRRRKSREKRPRGSTEDSEDGKQTNKRSLKEENADKYAQVNPIYESTPRLEESSQVETVAPEFIEISVKSTPQSPAVNKRKRKTKKQKNRSQNNSRKGGLPAQISLDSAVGTSSTEILWQPNQDDQLPSNERNSDNLSDYFSFDDDYDDEWSGTEGYESITFTDEIMNAISDNPYSTIGGENTYESVANVTESPRKGASVKSHIYEKAEEIIEMSEFSTSGEVQQSAAMSGENYSNEHVYDKANEKKSLEKEFENDSKETTVTNKDGSSSVCDETEVLADNKDNIYDAAEGYEGQAVEKPKENRLSKELSRSMLSLMFEIMEQKIGYSSNEDNDEYDSPENIIVA